MRITLIQLDGKLPNLALMKLAHWHKAQGDEVFFTRSVYFTQTYYGDDLFFQLPDRVYASAIFSYSTERVEILKQQHPEAILGGTYNLLDNRTVEQFLELEEYEHYDYSILPPNRKGELFDASIGFTARGCRLKCGFCVVPKKEGRPRSVNTIADIWRGPTTPDDLEGLKQARKQTSDPEYRKRLDKIIANELWPKHLHLLDNDFFGQAPDQWKARIAEIKAGKFKVCFNQGINTRMITEESAAALASIQLYDDSFTTRRLYTAWDNLRDEERFFRGVDTLERAGIKSAILLVYMLVGYDPEETWDRVLYRFKRMAARDIRPYPMIYGEHNRYLEPAHPTLGRRTLADFQRWAIRKYYTVVDFEHYEAGAKGELPNWRETAPIYSD
jgi:hypothetical protein